MTRGAGKDAINQILVEEHGDGIRAIVLNRPEKRNAFTSDMIDRLYRVLADAVDDADVRVIVLRAKGEHFCAGGDLDEMLQRGARDALGRKNNVWKEIERIPLLLERSDKPMIAAMQGACRGAGVDLGLMCDIRVAARSVEFAETYVNLGLLSGAGGGWFLPRIVGTARALEMFWTGETLDAAEAERIGLVTHVVDDEKLVDHTLTLARKIANQPIESVRFFRRSVYQGLTTPLYAYLDMVSSHMSVLRDTTDHRARIQALMTKRG